MGRGGRVGQFALSHWETNFVLWHFFAFLVVVCSLTTNFSLSGKKTIKDIFVFRFSRFRIIVFLLLLLLLLVLEWRATRPNVPSPPHLCNGIGILIEMFHSIPPSLSSGHGQANAHIPFPCHFIPFWMCVCVRSVAAIILAASVKQFDILMFLLFVFCSD